MTCKWNGFRLGHDIPFTPADLDDAGWMLWATPTQPDGLRRYYARRIIDGRKTRAYTDPDRTVSVVRRYMRGAQP